MRLTASEHPLGWPTLSQVSGSSPVIAVEVSPPAPGTVVVLVSRRQGGRSQQTHVPRERASERRLPLYRAVLPRLGLGEQVRYRLELRRDGRCLATWPEDGSWLTHSATPTADPGCDGTDGTDGSSAAPGAQPVWDHRLEFFGTCTVELRADVIGATPDGYRVNFSCVRGHLRGPHVDAEETGGNDYVCVRPDGIAQLHKIATWRNADGAVLIEEATGVTDLGPDGYERISRGPWTGEPPATIASSWASAHPDWQWLTRVRTVGVGRTIAQGLHLRLDIYVPVVGERRRDA